MQNAIASSLALIASETSFLIEKSSAVPFCSSIPRRFFFLRTFLLITIAAKVMAIVSAFETGKDTQSQ